MSVLEVLRRFTSPTQTDSALDKTIVALKPFQSELPAGLADALQTNDVPVQLLSLQVIRELGSEVAMTVPHIVAMLSNDDRCVRLAAASALGAIGSAAKSALPKLESLLDCDDVFERLSTATSILEIDNRYGKALAVIFAQLRDTESQHRCFVTTSLGWIGCVDAVPVLNELVEDKDSVLQSEASLALCRITGESEAARIVGRKLITDPDGITRQIGREHLQELNEILTQQTPAKVTELILRAEVVGKPPAVRYLILNVIENTWWDGQAFQSDSNQAVRYATSGGACADMQFILKQHYGDLPVRRYVIPMEIEVYGDVSAEKIARYLHQTSELNMRTEEYGNGPGESVVLPQIRWGQIRESE